MTVIVSSLITKSGQIESGDIPMMVTIHTDPGYEPNPGHAGTGTVTSVVCGNGPQHAVVTTNPATNLTTSSAKLNGSLNPHGLTTTVYFKWGTTTSYGHTTTAQTKTGNTSLPITANISGLTTHHTYHFRIVATNSAGTRTGSDLTFNTP
jgi:ribonuclease HI